MKILPDSTAIDRHALAYAALDDIDAAVASFDLDAASVAAKAGLRQFALFRRDVESAALAIDGVQ